MAQGAAFRPQGSDGLGVGAVLALLAHLLLVGALALGVRWNTHAPTVVEAEVWAEVPRAAAQQAPPPPQEVAPPPVPVEAAPPPEVVPEPEPIAELARHPEPKRKPKVKDKAKEKPVPPVVKAEPKPVKPKKVREPVETFITTPPVVVKKPASTVTPPSAATYAEREAQRRANLDRMMNDLGGQGGLGTSSRSAGPSASYGGKLRARIIPNIVFPGTVNGNPAAFVEIRCAADGRILSRRLLESSGSPEWDAAVLRGVDKTEFLPLDENGRLPDTIFQIGFSPKDR